MSTIDKSLVLQYLGHTGQHINADLDKIINDCMSLSDGMSKKRHVFKVFKCMPVEDGVQLLGTNVVLPGQDIKKHLEGAYKCVLFCGTIGIEVDNHLRKLYSTDMTKAVVFDGCCTALIESYCDEIELTIKAMAKAENKFITSRYSPGYGDFLIESQNDFLLLLDTARQIGVTIENVMVPLKSVTAIIGFVDSEPKDIKPACETCNIRENCEYKKRGATCGK